MQTPLSQKPAIFGDLTAAGMLPGCQNPNIVKCY